MAPTTQMPTVTSQAIWDRGTPVFCPAVSDAPLTPALALEYLDELSTDIRAAVVLDGEGRLAAGPEDADQGERVRELTRELFERADSVGGAAPVSQVEVTLPGGAVFAVRGERFTIAVVSTRYALSSLMFYDLRHVIDDLGGAAA